MADDKVLRKKILERLNKLLGEYSPVSITESATRNAIRMCIRIVKETKGNEV